MSTIIFENNKYYNWYCSIVELARVEDRTKTSEEYYEKHHIVPRSLGGTNDPKNLVLLTGREHFICHLLLTKCTIGSSRYKMMNALSFFTTRNLNSRQYNIACKNNSLAKQGSKNGMYGKTPWNKGKTRYLSDNAKERIRAGQQRWRDAGGASDMYKEKISKSLKGRKKPEEFGRKLSQSIKGKNHWSFKGYYCTPFGKLTSSTEAEDIVPNQLVRRWCKNPDKKITIQGFSQSVYLQSLGSEIIGKTYRDVGFYFEDAGS
jgi:hypothetical protein